MPFSYTTPGSERAQSSCIQMDISQLANNMAKPWDWAGTMKILMAFDQILCMDLTGKYFEHSLPGDPAMTWKKGTQFELTAETSMLVLYMQECFLSHLSNSN